MIGSDLDKVIQRTKKSSYPGLWPGLVEYAHDPLMLGRVMVRIPSIHGDINTTKSEKLPWATRSELGGGGYDFGSFMPLTPGAGVWVMFVNDDIDSPVIIGTYSSMPVKRGLYGQSNLELLPIEGSDSSMGPWKGTSVVVPEDDIERGQTEIPAEARQAAFQEPTVMVPFKSWKGAAIVVEERDGMEKLEILDRGGQGLQMKFPISKDLNQYNKMQRGTRSVFKGNQFDYKNHTENRESSVSLRDASQSGLLMEAIKEAERTKLTSKASSSTDTQSTLDFEMGANIHSIELGAGHQRTIIEGKRAGQSMFKLSFDGQRGILDFDANLLIRFSGQKMIFSAENAVFKSNVMVDGDLTVSGDSTVIGESTTGSPERDLPS